MEINPTTGQEEVLGYDPTQVGIPGVNMAPIVQPPQPTPQVATTGTTPQNPPMMTPQPTQPVQPVVQQTATPQPTTKAVEQKPIEVPTSIDEWKKQGSNMGTLEQMIEKSYGTVAENKNGTLQADIGGVGYQWTIDQAGNPIKTKVGGEDSQLIFSQLMAGKKFDDTGVQTTPEFYKAKARYDVANQYMGMGEEQLYNAYLNGDIGPELEKDLLMNPYLALAKDKINKKTVTDSINKDSVTMLNAYNKANNDKYTPVTVKKTPLEMLSDKFMASFESTGKTDQIDSFKNYMQTNYPNIVTDSLKLNGKTQELQKLTDERDKRLDEIIKENPGISINRATMLATRENKDINAQIQSMGYEIQNLSANIKNQTDMANQEYTYAIQQQERKDAIEKEKRAYLYQQIETQQALESSQAQAEAKQQQQDFENTLKLQELQTKLGDRKTTVIKDEATGEQKLIDSTTGETIQSFKTGLKPETMSPYQKAQTELDKQKLALDQKKFEAEKGLIDTSISNGVVPSIAITSKWGRAEKGPVQCGEFVNDSLKEKGIEGVNFGDKYTEKINAINQLGISDKPLPGSIFVLKTGEKEGHTGIVQSVNADGSIVVQEANRDATDEGTEPTEGTYKSTAGMTFSKPVILEEREYNDNDISLLSSVSKLDKQGKDTLRQNGFTEQDWAKFNSGLLPPTNSQKETAQDILNSISDLESHDGLKDAIGFKGIQTGYTIPGSDKANFMAKFNNFIDNLVLPNLGKLKGPMSDKDIAFLKSSASALNVDMSEAGFKEELNKLKAKYTDLINKGNIQPQQNQSLPQNEIDLFDSYYNPKK